MRLPKVGEVVNVHWRPVFSTDEGFNAYEGVVVETLSTQFLVEIITDEGATVQRMYFYKDHGDSWHFPA